MQKKLPLCSLFSTILQSWEYLNIRACFLFGVGGRTDNIFFIAFLQPVKSWKQTLCFGCFIGYIFIIYDIFIFQCCPPNLVISCITSFFCLSTTCQLPKHFCWRALSCLASAFLDGDILLVSFHFFPIFFLCLRTHPNIYKTNLVSKCK